MNRVKLSRAAAADLEAIDDYTIEHFGVAQAKKTLLAFEAALVALADRPRDARLPLPGIDSFWDPTTVLPWPATTS